jgi:hypothetical protein
VILRLLRNEKYCGDLVQKKTYTPDFLSHDKKYNRGQEEFIIIKDHHEPIISRELFEEANRILDARALSPEGKAKHSNRYPFSGKIKCGICGRSFVARYKKRGDGSVYKAWRCQEAANHGSPHKDKAGNEVGCSCVSIRNEDAIHILYLVTKSLQYDKEAVIGNLLSVVKAVVDMDSTGTDVTKPQRKISEPEESRAKLLDAFLSGIITKEEFTRSRSRLDDEIADPQAMLDNVDRQRSPTLQENKRMEEIERAVREIIGGVEHEDAFYRQILDKMVVYGHDRIDVCLNALPFRWSYSL